MHGVVTVHAQLLKVEYSLLVKMFKRGPYENEIH